MFFPERIKNINPSDKVLEIGPGASPHVRSDVLLEKKFETQKEYELQFGHKEKLTTEKKIVFYSGDTFPFSDKEFDYVICSHVLEHVEDLNKFMSEIFRVAGKGYFEYPLIYYEYLYNFHVHLNFLKYDGETLFFKKKSSTKLAEFLPVQKFFYQTLQKGHVKLINDLLSLMMEGFEWNCPFEIKEAKDIEELVLKNCLIPQPTSLLESTPSTKYLMKQLIKKIVTI